MTKDLAMFLGLVAGLIDSQYMQQSFDELINDPIFKMMRGEDEYDSKSTEETSNS